MRPEPEANASLIDRRRFLAGVTASALFLSAHDVAALARAPGAGGSRQRPAAGASGPRILALELATATPLAEMAAFYGEVLGLPVRDEGDKIAIAAGATEITFFAAAGSEAPPFYHFAFNIPETKILAARSWQLERTPLFLTPEGLRDPDFPNDVRHFRTWNAHSVFFWDPAGNVVEYIARHDLASSAAGRPGGSFSSRDILYASEIAFVVDDVPGAASRLETTLSLPRYRNASDVFHASGDERGLLLLFGRGRDIGDRLRDRPAPAAVFPTRARIRGSGPATHAFAGYPYEVESARRAWTGGEAAGDSGRLSRPPRSRPGRARPTPSGRLAGGPAKKGESR